MKRTSEIQKMLAYEYAKDYCRAHNLSADKLLTQRFSLICDSAIFAQPSEKSPEGLTNDMETMPFPTLVIRLDGGALKVEATEFTEQYLS